MTARRAGQVLPAVRVVARTTRWEVLAGAGGCSALLLWWQDDRLSVPNTAMWMLRAATLLLAAAVAFGADDPARDTVAALPTPLWWRTLSRLAVTIVPVALLWLLFASWVGGRSARPLPWSDLALEAAAFYALALAVSVGLSRWRAVAEPGAVVAPAMLGIGLLLTELPEPVVLIGFPGPDWGEAHRRLAGLLVVALVVLAAALSDPARRGVRGLAACGHR